jgi:hypothetical protein
MERIHKEKNFFCFFPNRKREPLSNRANGKNQRPVRLKAFGPIQGVVDYVEMRTLCQFHDTCPQLNEVLLSPLADLPLKIRS